MKTGKTVKTEELLPFLRIIRMRDFILSSLQIVSIPSAIFRWLGKLHGKFPLRSLKPFSAVCFHGKFLVSPRKANNHPDPSPVYLHGKILVSAQRNTFRLSSKVSSSWLCLLFGWTLASLSWRDQSQIHEFCKDVDDGFVLARIWTTTVWTDDCRELALAIANRQ